MKIVIDLQSLQTTGSRHRGIGRYSLSLAKTMLSEGKQNEFIVVINGNFSETVDDVKNIFADYLPPENIMLFQTPTPVAENNFDNQWRSRTAELVREQFFEQLRPDWVHITSLFEGFGDNAVTSVNCFAKLPTAVTLYDLIPYRHPQQYLNDPSTKSWYMRKLAYLRKAELVLAISDFSRKEAIEVLGLPENRVVNISTDADENFCVKEIDAETIRILHKRYGIVRDIVMYTGGIDYRKNIEGLIKAYANLPAAVRESHQLVICCRVLEDERNRLQTLASKSGLSKDEMVLTGYVSDEDLITLYNCCKLFVFPSLTEGFGLPALEAMRCGAAVIGSNTSSIPEVIGIKEALFDPRSITSISEKLNQTLIDDQFRLYLREQARVQAAKFSWRNSARRAVEAMESLSEQGQSTQNRQKTFLTPTKPKLAYLSPLPPEKSGIADYSAELLPELANYYDIDLITELKEIADSKLSGFKRHSIIEFKNDGHKYDRVLYQFGNSTFHSHMFFLLPKIPGTVVLHDFFLSGVLHSLENTTSESTIFRQALYRSHGYPALESWHKNPEEAMWAYPCCLDILQEAQGLIVHSEFSRNLAERFFSFKPNGLMEKIPHLRRMAGQFDRDASRGVLGMQKDSFVVCSFGMIAPTKLNGRLLDAWLNSDLLRDNRCRLIFVGDGQGNAYEKMLLEKIQISGRTNQILITGYADAELYHHYLAAADVGVQLRTRSRGETSGTVFDCMARGLATIVNSHGSLAELPSDAVIKLPDEFTDDELLKALEGLCLSPARRETLGQGAGEYVKNNLYPPHIAKQYAEAIESFNENHPLAVQRRLLTAIVNNPVKSPSIKRDFIQTAAAISENTLSGNSTRQLLVDVTNSVNNKKRDFDRETVSIVKQLILNYPDHFRVEPIYRLDGIYRYARSFTAKLFDVREIGLADSPVDARPRDVFLTLGFNGVMDESTRNWLQHQSQRGLELFAVVYDLLPVLKPNGFPANNALKVWLESFLILADGIIFSSKSLANEFGNWLQQRPVKRQRPLRIGCLAVEHDNAPAMDDARQLKQVLFGSRWIASWEAGRGFHWNV